MEGIGDGLESHGSEWARVLSHSIEFSVLTFARSSVNPLAGMALVN